jgi:glutathione S-transferase
MERRNLPLLWQYSFSNFNEKVRWALDHKRIPHRRRSLLPMGPRSLWFSRGAGTLPALDLDGERIVDSTRIIAALEERHPDPLLYPADPREREHALALEDFFDEHAGHDVRRLGFMESWDETEFGARMFTTDQPAPIGFAVRKVAPVIRPVLWRFVDRRYGFDATSFENSKQALRAALDRIEAERSGGPYLAGDSFTVADLTAAALLYPLVWPDEYPYELPEPPPSPFRESVGGHPALDWLRGIWRRHRGESAEVR